jgi:hypothetical protein
LLLILKTGNWTLFERLVLWTYAVATTVELGDYEMEEVYEGAAHPVRVSESKHYSPRIIIVTQCFLTSACVTSARHTKIKDALGEGHPQLGQVSGSVAGNLSAHTVFTYKSLTAINKTRELDIAILGGQNYFS